MSCSFTNQVRSASHACRSTPQQLLVDPGLQASTTGMGVSNGVTCACCASCFSFRHCTVLTLVLTFAFHPSPLLSPAGDCPAGAVEREGQRPLREEGVRAAQALGREGGCPAPAQAGCQAHQADPRPGHIHQCQPQRTLQATTLQVLSTAHAVRSVRDAPAVVRTAAWLLLRPCWAAAGRLLHGACSCR